MRVCRLGAAARFGASAAGALLFWEQVGHEAEPGRLARFQLNGFLVDGQACFAALDESNLRYTRLDPRPIEDGCGLLQVVRFEQSKVDYSTGFDLSCAMAAALYWYEAEVDRLAAVDFDLGLAEIEHFGSYACRNINCGMSGHRSQHATANALDIAAFVLGDGRRIAIIEHWEHQSEESRSLASAHDAACGMFNTVLGPDYNVLHADHIHIDTGRIRTCR
ncbi:MAG: extensin [Rhodospirillaceae bacterium]|nr:extensin [Rhodospirillaceae bacterium]|tara:strand:+ start:7873 stop:8532 length:660 start_codon:yes stop_codon:yes gene_type:complete